MRIDIIAETGQPQFILREVARRVADDPSYLMVPTLQEASRHLQAWHASEGKGLWRRHRRTTIERRKRAGQRSGTPIGVQSGRLRASLVYGHPDHEVVKLHDQVWYSYPNARVIAGGRSAGLAFLFNARRRLWPPLKRGMEASVQDIARRLVDRRIQEVLNGS